MTLHELQRRVLPAAVVMDAVVFCASLAMAHGVLTVFGVPLPTFATMEEFLQSIGLPFFLAPVGYVLTGMYRAEPYRLVSRSAERAFYGTLFAALAVMAVTYVARGYLTPLALTGAAAEVASGNVRWGIPFSVMLLGPAIAAVLVPLWRFSLNWLENRFWGLSKSRVRMVVVGVLSEADLIRIRRRHSPCYDVVGYIEGRIVQDTATAMVCLGPINELGAILDRERADELLVMAGQVSRECLMRCIEESAARGVRVWVAMDVYATVVSSGSLSLRGTVPVFELRERRLLGWELAGKRIMDVLISGLVLLFAVPLVLLPACILIVVDSKGFPVFCQNRVGVGGRIFRLYKLRTMVVDAEDAGPRLTADHDPRITRVGHFLRATSIDELPQLWNVLMGDMSLVGPRAVVPYVVERFEEWERASLSVKPGLTGLAQVSGRDEIGFREKSLLNIYYIRNFSLWLDLRIILATFRVLLTMEGTGGTRRD